MILVPIEGVAVLHTIHGNGNKWTDPFLVMPNVKPSSGVLFDIKGHCDSRFVPENDFRDFKFGKDENFIKSRYLK